MQGIIDSAQKPYDLAIWLMWETGIRRGEVCALDIKHLDLEHAIIVVRFSRSGSTIKPTKSRKPRVFSLSPQIVDALRVHVAGRNPNEALFLSAEGKRLHPDNFGKRILEADPQGPRTQGRVSCFTPRKRDDFGWAKRTI